MQRLKMPKLNVPDEEPTTRSAATGITRPSKVSTLQKLSKPEINAGSIVGDLIDRFRRQAGWNLADEQTEEAKKDRQELILVFLEVLGATGARPEHYERLYRRAMRTRASRRANGERLPYHITAEEMAAEWFPLEKELRETETEKTEELCGFRANHENGERVVTYFPYGEPMVLPCHECRPAAHAARKAYLIEVRNKSFANRRLAAAPLTPAEAVAEAFRPPKEAFLDPAAAKEIRDEYNELVRLLVEDETARNRLFVIFDEGANVFRHPERVDVVYSEKVMRDKIERYRQVLEERGK